MPYEFSLKSKEKLATCDQRLQDLFNRVIQRVDCTIIEGRRSAERQDHLFEMGFSKLRWPDSKHNSTPSIAIDAAPYVFDVGIPWNNQNQFCYFAGIVMGIAFEMGIELRWGGDFNRNDIPGDQKFFDAAHFELI